MKFFGLLLCFLFCTPPLFAQDFGSLNGRIMDEFSGDPIQYAKVSLQIDGASYAQVLANASGDYVFWNIEEGYYDLVIQKSGFSPLKITDVFLAPNENLEFNPTFEGEGYDNDTIVYTFVEMYKTNHPSQHFPIQKIPNKKQKIVARRIAN